MAKLIAFGDSFTWGSDMGDTMRDFEWWAQPGEWRKHNRFTNLYSRRTWQAMLAAEHELNYECVAVQGCSNQTIVRTFFENVQRIRPDDIVSVNFTWRNRYDFYNDLNDEWHTVRPSGTEDVEYHELYYKHLHNTIWDQVESLKAINLIIDYLKLNNIQYIATCIDENIYKDMHHSTPLIHQLQKQHKDDITWFDGIGFHEWSKQNDFEISPMWHPLEDAHKAALEYIKGTEHVRRIFG